MIGSGTVLYVHGVMIHSNLSFVVVIYADIVATAQVIHLEFISADIPHDSSVGENPQIMAVITIILIINADILSEFKCLTVPHHDGLSRRPVGSIMIVVRSCQIHIGLSTNDIHTRSLATILIFIVHGIDARSIGNSRNHTVSGDNIYIFTCALITIPIETHHVPIVDIGNFTCSQVSQSVTIARFKFGIVANTIFILEFGNVRLIIKVVKFDFIAVIQIIVFLIV